jgi:2-oxoglutarate dehydrogenase E2 component (dihydrolipoamide succinyltransferase)
MAQIRIVMPQLGESVAEATLTRWRVKEGDRVERDQTLAEVSTDKADTELPAPEPGRVLRLLVSEGETVPVQTPIALIETEMVAAMPEQRPAQPAAARPAQLGQAAPPPEAPSAPERAASARVISPRAERPRTSPLVRRIAKEQHVELSQVQGHGAGGRVTKQDILDFLMHRPAGEPSAPAPASRLAQPPPSPQPPREEPRFSVFRPPEYKPMPGDQVVPFTRRRKLIAEHMIYSKRTSPHVACMAEVDLHRADATRREAAKRGENVSWLALVAWAAVKAVRDYPIVNASVLENGYVLHKEVNLAVAVDTEQGLVVPVIKNAEVLSPEGLTRAATALGERARAGRLTADDLAGGTLSLSNPGARGNTWGIAVINQPQVAILRMGEVIKRPVVVTIEGEDTLAVHPTMDLVLSYDHRIIDGVAGNGYLRRVKELLETLA